MRDLLVKISMKLGLYKTLVKVGTKFRNKKMAKAFHKYGLETLMLADKIMRSHNAQMFLDYGTLLGAYRDKNFIAHDFDLDVGVLSSQRPDDIVEIMAKYGFSHKREFYVKETGRITEDQFEYKGVQIDFFYYFDRGDDIYCYLANAHETKEWKEANRTDGFPCMLFPCPKMNFVEKEFLGKMVYMPEDTDTWLRKLYGDNYMTPIKDWSDQNRKSYAEMHNERLYRR